MASELVTQFNQLKAQVDRGKQEYAAAQRELEVNTGLYDQKLAEVQEKFGCATIEELQAKAGELEGKITGTMTKISDILTEVRELERASNSRQE